MCDVPGLPRLLAERGGEVKASSLPNVFAREMQVSRSRSSLVPSTTSATRYSRLKISGLPSSAAKELGNGRVVETYTPSPAKFSSSSPEKQTTPILDAPKDNLSLSQSLNSRKDSGIRSRRSSIQEQIFGLSSGVSPSEHRLSGYYSSSQYSLNEIEKGKGKPLGHSFTTCFQKLRKQSDIQLTKCVQSNSIRSESFDPPLHKWSLLFKDPEIEEEYRRNAHKISSAEVNRAKTFATPKFNTYFDVTISFIVFTSVTLPTTFPWAAGSHLPWLVAPLACLELTVIIFCLASALLGSSGLRSLKCLLNWYPWQCAGGALVSLPLLVVLAHQLLAGGDGAMTPHLLNQSTSLLFVCLVHFCNFTQLNCWMKSCLATVGSLLYLGLITGSLLSGDGSHLFGVSANLSSQSPAATIDNSTAGAFLLPQFEEDSLRSKRSEAFRVLNDSRERQGLERMDLVTSNAFYNRNFFSFSRHNNKSGGLFLDAQRNRTLSHNLILNPLEKSQAVSDVNNNVNNSIFDISNHIRVKRFNTMSKDDSFYQTDVISVISRTDAFLIENYLGVLLLILLVWFLNREFEISYRLSFHGNLVAAKDKARVVKMKNQADWLLFNIIPPYVAEHLKSDHKSYSEDVKNAGILFASIVNFGEMYDESFKEGRECLRVLNELVSDFDELLSNPKFSSVEKIKTIGSTFMAASGLNLNERKPNDNEHLFQLMEFALALQEAIDNFNKHLLEFNLILRVGYNFGDVTAGVIGTTKFHYDIWGDAVNIASRMDSTGVARRIQVPSACLRVLSQRYVFEPRGTVYVKGKDDMEVHLLVGRRL